MTIINRRPVVGPYGLRYFNYKDGDIYVKGAWILHSLRVAINNDSVFFDIIKTFATRYAYRNAASKDFISLVNEKTGTDYQWFFDQYLYNRFVPDMEYFQDDGRLYYRWNAEVTNSSFKGPVIVKTGPSLWDTVYPALTISVCPLNDGSEADVEDNTLTKYTENRKLKKLYKRQLRISF
jgi:hypothetical protein